MNRARSISKLIARVPPGVPLNIAKSWILPATSSFRSYASAAAPPPPTALAAEPFLNGSSSNYVEDMYQSWLHDPNSVHKVSFFLFLIYNPKILVKKHYFVILFKVC